MPPVHRFRAPVDVLNYEIVQEQAAALAVLREFDAAHSRSEASPEERQTRRTLVAVAGEALWTFVVQRESCGLRDSRSLMRDYKVPAEVQERMGVFPATRR